MNIAVSKKTTGSHLLRGIRRWDLVALVLNSVIGAGIFALPARAYYLAGVYSILSYLVCSVPVFLIILCFAEVSSRFDGTGGPYLYARSTFGRVVGFEIGWLAWVVRLTAFAALSNLFVDYLGYFVPAASFGAGRSVVIIAIVVVLAAANISGVRLASVMGNVFVIGKLIPLVLLVTAGAFFVQPSRYSAAVVPGFGDFSASVLLLVFAFTGFEIATIPAGEAQDPKRNLPFALMTGSAIALLLYMVIQIICIGIVPELGASQRPLAEAGGQIFGRAGAAIISLGTLISVTGTMNAIILSAPRLLFAMAEEEQLPAALLSTHHRFKTPYTAILITSAGILVFALSGTFASAATLSTIIRLSTYAVTCAALPILRRKYGLENLTFRVPAGGAVAASALVLILWLFSSSSWAEARLALLVAIAGLVVYAAANRSSRPKHGAAIP